MDDIDLNADQGILGDHKWEAQWRQLPEPHQHVGVMDLKHYQTIFGVRVPYSDLHVEAMQIGPAMVHLRLDAGIFGKGIYVQTVTPLQPFLQKLVHQIYAERKMPNVVAKLLLWGEAQQVCTRHLISRESADNFPCGALSIRSISAYHSSAFRWNVTS